MALHGLVTELVEEYKEKMKEEFKYILSLKCDTKLKQTGIWRKRNKYFILSLATLLGDTINSLFTTFSIEIMS